MSDFYLELLKYFRHLGKALGFAFEDIADKAQKFLNNQKKMVELKNMSPGDKAHEYVEDFIELEIQQGVAFASGHNNRTVLAGHPQYNAYKNYISTSWNFIRGAWLFDFVSELSRRAWVETECTLQENSTKAYEHGLERHHPWWLRHVVHLGLRACPSNESFFNSLKTE